MRFILPVLFCICSLHAISQTVTVSGRCYYDLNGNHIFDGEDIALVGAGLTTHNGSTIDFTETDELGQYTFEVYPGIWYFSVTDPVSAGYEDLYSQTRVYTTGGTDIIDFAYQLLDSVTEIRAYIEPEVTGENLPAAGGTKRYALRYGYRGSLEKMPATVTLSYNQKLLISGISVPPTSAISGKLQWNFPELAHGRYGEIDSIKFNVTYPATGDTIASYILSPNFIPGIDVTTQPYLFYDYNEYIDHSGAAGSGAGASAGVKWLRQFTSNNGYEEGTSIDTTQNGQGYFIAANRSVSDSFFSHSVPFIAKLNKDGLSVWERYLDELPEIPGFRYISAIRHTMEGGCIVTGSSYLQDSFNYTSDLIVAKFDSTGKLVWNKNMKGSRTSSAGYNLLVLADGGCMFTGDTYASDQDFANTHPDTAYNNLFVTRLSATGDIIFTKVYGGTNYDYGYRIEQLQNGTFIVLGGTASVDGDVKGAHPKSPDTYSNPEEAWVLNIDGNGNIIWNRCFGGSKESYITGAIDNDGGILLTGATDSKDGDLPYYPEQGASLWAIQISGTGNILWNKLYKLYKGYQDTNYVTSPLSYYSSALYSGLHKTKDGNFIAGGIASDKYGTIRTKHGNDDFLVLKLSKTGDIIWQKAIGGSGYEYINEMQLDKNDDIIFIGGSESDDDDLYLHSALNNETFVVGKVGITNIIQGKVFVDNNNNHIKDATEHYYSQGRINSVKYTDTISARIFEGKFLNNVDTGNYVSSYLPANNYYTVFPATHTTSFNTFDLKDSFDIALTPKPNVNDLEVQLLPLNTPRPGFDVMYRIITKNVGTTTINNVVIGLKKDNRQTYIDASRTNTGILADSIWWGPFTLNAFDIDTLYLSLKLAAPPALNNGDTLAITVTANPVVNDSSTANNRFNLKELVRGSFDPNDKKEIHAGTLTTTQYASGEYLQYQVRFQNTGTDTAFFVTVKDTLQAGIDLKTLEIVSASHPYTFRLEGNVATWDFKNIHLADSTTDEPASHGFILFKVKPKAGLTVGDEFTNKAAIYFDFNLPVITNEDKTVIGSKAGVCPAGNVSFIAGVAGSSFQWQVNTGSGFINLANNGIYSGVNTATLVLTAPPTSMSGYRYRCVVNGNINSPENRLKFSARWKGAAGTAWENTANWDCGILPDAQTEVIIPGGITNYPLVNTNASCYSLRLSPGSTVQVKTGFKLTITGKAN